MGISIGSAPNPRFRTDRNPRWFTGCRLSMADERNAPIHRRHSKFLLPGMNPRFSYSHTRPRGTQSRLPAETVCKTRVNAIPSVDQKLGRESSLPAGCHCRMKGRREQGPALQGGKERKHPVVLSNHGVFLDWIPAITYFRTGRHYHRPRKLNCRVRNGNECCLSGMFTGKSRVRQLSCD